MNSARRATAFCLAVLVAELACKGSPAPVTPNLTPTPVPPIPTSAPVALSCPLGHADAQCDSHSDRTFLGELNAALDRVIARHPELFNLAEFTGPGQYHILKVPEFINAVVAELNAAGLCAESLDQQNVKIKAGNDYSERYAIVTSRGFIRRDNGAYLETCRPASFPLSNADYIDRVRVGFFNFQCNDQRTPPEYTDFILPMPCLGFVTATPKDKNLVSVPRSIHGNNITWELVDGAGVIRLIPDPTGEEFNMLVDPVRPGHFVLCATVLGKRGCLVADVVQ